MVKSTLRNFFNGLQATLVGLPPRLSRRGAERTGRLKRQKVKVKMDGKKVECEVGDVHHVLYYGSAHLHHAIHTRGKDARSHTHTHTHTQRV